MISKIVKKLVSPYTFESFKIEIENLRNNSPILIYSMGKVGSSTVYKSLKKSSLTNPVYHIHFLNHYGIKHHEEIRIKAKATVPDHIRISKILRRKIDKTKGINWQVITLVREPISRLISSIFHDPEVYYPDLVDEHSNIRNSHALEFVQNIFMNYDKSIDDACQWFDNELKTVFDFDIYNFSHNDGFNIIQTKNVNVLVLNSESLRHSFNNALTKFLVTNNPVKLLNSNINENRKHTAAYKYVLENITIPKSLCTEIYSSKYAKHFYSESRINELIQKWSRELI